MGAFQVIWGPRKEGVPRRGTARMTEQRQSLQSLHWCLLCPLDLEYISPSNVISSSVLIPHLTFCLCLLLMPVQNRVIDLAPPRLNPVHSTNWLQGFKYSAHGRGTRAASHSAKLHRWAHAGPQARCCCRITDDNTGDAGGLAWGRRRSHHSSTRKSPEVD